jgi:hypothetical protein
MGPLGFFSPAFFFGVAALAVPIVIHLIHRERRERLPFPSLMFLRKIPYRSVRRQKIRHWLLLALRSAAIVLLVLAFARPYLARSTQAGTPLGGARELVILLDRSYSMAYGDHWTRATAAAADAIESLGPADRASLVLFAERAEAVNLPTSQRSELRAAVETARPGSGVTRYGPALKLARKILEESSLPRREVLLVTDFQKVGWDGQEEVRLPEGTALTRVDVSHRESTNVTVASVVLEREWLSGRERIVVSPRLTNKGAKAYPKLDVALELNQRALQVKEVTLEPNSSSVLAFSPFILPEGTSRGTVRIGEDPLAPDNQFHFVLSPGQSLPVLIVEGPQGRRDRSLFLTRALSLGDRPSFQTQVKKGGALSAADLGRASVVIFNDAPAPGAESGRALRDFVEKGGGLIVALGETSAPAAWAATAGELLPGPFGTATDRSSDWGGTLAFLDYSHPAFEIFSAPRSGDFSSARFFRYRTLTAEQGVLARFDDGAVAIAEKKIGRGKVLVFTSTLDSFWNDLGLQPVFLPFVHQLVKYAGRFAEARSWYRVGEVMDLSSFPEKTAAAEPSSEKASGATRASLIVTTPSGKKIPVGAGEDSSLLVPEEQGFYEVRSVGGEGRLQTLAVNLDVTESDLSALDPEELAGAVAPVGQRSSAAYSGESTPEDQERRQAFWWYLLLGVLLLLAMETALSNRLSRAAKAQP